LAALTDLAVRSKAHWGYDEAFLEASMPDLAVTAERFAISQVVVAEDAAGVTGFATLGGAPPEMELAQLFVEPSRIGTGVGRTLVRHVVSMARQADAASLAVDSDPNAEGFYRRLGFERVGSVPSIVDPRRRLSRFRLAIG
jgi:N-acetylglutamate synthase-like GNAT family acetyltransferase